MSQQPKKLPSNIQVIGFIVILSFVCAFVLSLLSSALEKPQQIARELDRSEQMMIAANIMNHDGNFLIENEQGEIVFAKYGKDGYLIPGSEDDFPSRDEIVDVYRRRFRPLLVDKDGKPATFEEAGIEEASYLTKYKKEGYYKQSYKLVYEILPNSQETEPVGYVIPINGFGLWDAIYGYLAIEPDGNTIIGISWYDQKETPGLGANIAESDWQSQFPGKKIFQANPDGTTDFKLASLGVLVVRGKVVEVLGEVPKANSAVDGMSGATLTGNGVTKAYQDVLEAYRPFLLHLQETGGGE